MLVFTLSTIPPRFDLIGPTLASMLAQAVKADHIFLYIPETYRRFPDWDGTLPSVPDGVEIVRTPLDLGPATKILPAAHSFRGQDVDILFGDDDRIYPPQWAARFLAARDRYPGRAIAARGISADRILPGTGKRPHRPRAKSREERWDVEFHLRRAWNRLTQGARQRPPERRHFSRSGYIDIFEGCSGVLVRPDFFDDATFDIPDIAWAVDDIWLSANLARQGIPIWLMANLTTPPNTHAQQSAPLSDAVFDGADRLAANNATVRYARATLGVWI